jgi:hypothetical protein
MTLLPEVQLAAGMSGRNHPTGSGEPLQVLHRSYIEVLPSFRYGSVLADIWSEARLFGATSAASAQVFIGHARVMSDSTVVTVLSGPAKFFPPTTNRSVNFVDHEISRLGLVLV